MNFVKITNHIRMALSAIRMNLLRAILTMLIISLGIMALISMLTAVEGMKAAVYSNFAQVGSNTFTITDQDEMARMRQGFYGKPESPITLRQARALQRRFALDGYVSISYEASQTAKARRGDVETPPKLNVEGGDEYFLATNGLTLAAGRNFTKQEALNGNRVVILGHHLKEDLFGNADPVGESIRIGSSHFIVIGFLKEKGSMFGSDQDDRILMPLPAAQLAFPSKDENFQIAVHVNDVNQLDAAMEEATGIFRAIRRVGIGQPADFSLTRSDALLETLSEDIALLTGIAGAIGFITLLGAMVGLVNIMLVSVKERTREIGTRKALGATTATIRNQFLWEAIVITQAGGWFGIIMGIILGNIVASSMDGPFVIPWNWVFGGFIASIVIGLVSGLYPAIQAARLDPIESLRYE